MYLCEFYLQSFHPLPLMQDCQIIRKKGVSVRANVVMLTITLGIFALSTAYWAVSVASLVSDITQKHRQRNNAIRQVFNAVVLVNCEFKVKLMADEDLADVPGGRWSRCVRGRSCGVAYAGVVRCEVL